MNTFTELALPNELAAALQKIGFEKPTPIQAEAIPAALEGRDVVASAETGSGKTAAFGIPMITRLLADPAATALILAPTRELAVQIVKVIKDLSQDIRRFRAALLIGGVPMGGQMRALREGPRVIVATPGRLVDHLERRSVDLATCQVLVLDEADRMLDMGFAPQLERIRQFLSPERQTLLFSATMPPDIQALAAKWLRDPVRIAIGQVSRPVDRIEQKVVETDSSAKNDVLLKELKERSGSILIFARTKRRTDRLTSVLHGAGHKVVQIHGNRSQNQRQRALDGFRSGRYTILVATDIAARGLDIPEIAHVINYDMPMVPEDYVHRIGRTARAGRTGEALALVAPEERSLWRAVVRLMEKGESDTLKGGGGRSGPPRSKMRSRPRRDDNFSARPRAERPRRNRRDGDSFRAPEREGQAAGERPRTPRFERRGRGNSPRGEGRFRDAPETRAFRGERSERGERSDRGERSPRFSNENRGRHGSGPRSRAQSRFNGERSAERSGNRYVPFEAPEANGNVRPARRPGSGDRPRGNPGKRRGFRR